MIEAPENVNKLKVSTTNRINIFLVTRSAKMTSDEELVIKYLKFIEGNKNKNFKIPKFLSESLDEILLKDENLLKIVFLIKNE